MTVRNITNMAASVRQRLLNLGRQEVLDPNLVLVQYANERLLYRLATSGGGDRLVLKGAMLFLVWEGRMIRPTKDMDFLASGEPSAPSIHALFLAACNAEVADDGMRFDPDSIALTPLRIGGKYPGQRVVLTAHLGTALIPVQVDIGFGGAVTPAPRIISFPTLLPLPAPQVRAYQRETSISEKLHAVVEHGMANSRMKDYFDLWLLATTFAFDGPTLAGAIKATFERRDTPMPRSCPTGLTDEFGTDADKAIQWRAFLRRSRLLGPSEELDSVVGLVRRFLWPPLAALAEGQAFQQDWPAGGPWK